MSTQNINTLLDLWAVTLLKHNDTPPYANHTDLFDTIDSMPLGDVPWQSFSLNYNGEFPDDAPSWMTSTFDVWFQDPHLVAKNIIGSPDYGNQFDSAPTWVFYSKGHRQYQNFMSGDWCWEELVCFHYIVLSHWLSYNIYLGSDCEGPWNTWCNACSDYSWQRQNDCFCNNEYYPLYMLIGTVHNMFVELTEVL